MAALAIEDLVSRKWLTTVVSVEETSTQVKLGFTEALSTIFFTPGAPCVSLPCRAW
jgi:hypothetical protein